MKSRFSIRTAILVPFLLVMIGIVLIFSVMIKNSYETLAYDQGAKLIASVNVNVEEKLVNLLDEPAFVNSLFADFVSRNEFYKSKDYSNFQEMTIGFMSNILNDIPQINTFGVGDINKNYLGFRYNEDESFTLMVKDNKTENMLNIYDGATRASNVVAALEGYDPTTRPWYTPVVLDPVRQWSDIYVNYDEIQNTTITSIVPVFNTRNEVVGVTGIDVSLNGINTFLKAITEESGGIVYLVDSTYGVIAHSTDELMVTVLDTNPPTTKFTLGMNSNNPLIAHSSQFFDKNQKFGVVQQLEVDDIRYYTMMAPINNKLGLDWHITVVISEMDLLGNIESQFSSLRNTMISLGLAGLLIGSVTISIFTSSVVKIANSVELINTTSMDVNLFDEMSLSFKEIDKLKNAYTNMMVELKHSFNQISKSEKRYRSLIENSDALIFSMTTLGLILTYNKQVKNYIHLSDEELLKTSFFDLFNQTDKEKWAHDIKQVIKSHEPLDRIYEYFDSNKKRVVFKAKFIPVITEGEVETLIGTFIDIVELVESQEEIALLVEKEKEELERLVAERTSALEYAMEELVQKEKLASLGSLVTGISHEINTPLGVAVSASSYLKTTALKKKSKLLDGTLTKSEFIGFVDKIEESVLIIENNLLRANDLVSSFKQISVNKTYEEITNFNVSDYTIATIKSLGHEIKANKHQLSFNCDQSLELYGDPGSYSQVITNLILNSITHGYDDEQGHINIDVKDHSDHILITYTDDGKGIEESIVNKIFDPFFTTNRKNGGSGLGLNIVYNIITGQFGGLITVDNINGAVFTMKFPKRLED